MTLFRPCIDIHDNKVKQIVGSTLTEDNQKPQQPTPSSTIQEESSQEPSGEGPAQQDDLVTNFVSDKTPGHFASLYKQHSLSGAHVIMLGPGNTSAAQDGCAHWPYGLQVGGGINPETARWWVGPEGKAGKVIVTSYIFPDNVSLDWVRLDEILGALDGNREKLVIDLSCLRSTKEDGREGWFVATKQWTVVTDFEVNLESLCLLAPYCSEFLIHSVGVEGLQSGIDTDLVTSLGEWACMIQQILSAAGPEAQDRSQPLEVRQRLIRGAITQNPSFGGTPLTTFPITYAGGARNRADLELVHRISNGRVDLTIGSALDIFGGSGVTLDECVAWNQEHGQE